MKGKSFINGKWVVATGDSFYSSNPAYGEAGSRINWNGRAASVEDVEKAVVAANNAFTYWKNSDIDIRVNCVTRFNELLIESKEVMAEFISMDTGRPLWDSRQEVEQMIFSSNAALQAASNIRQEGMPHRSIGTFAVISSCCQPGLTAHEKIVPLLLSGNTIVYKPSGKTPLIAEYMVELWKGARLPKGVLNLLQGKDDAGKVVVANENINGVILTGNITTVTHVRKTVDSDKILSIETAGINSIIAHKVGDVRAAAYNILISSFMSTGQRGNCAKRLIMPQGNEAYNIIKYLRQMAITIKAGVYSDEDEPFMGPLIDKQAKSVMLEEQNGMKARGATMHLDMTGHVDSCYLTPGIIDVTEIENRNMTEFVGPLLLVVGTKNFVQALEEANNNCGNITTIITDSEKLYNQAVEGLNSEVINWNAPTTETTEERMIVEATKVIRLGIKQVSLHNNILTMPTTFTGITLE